MGKTKIFGYALIILLLIGCSDAKTEEIENLKQQISVLEEEKVKDEESLENFAALANELNASLEKINAEQHSIVSQIREEPEIFKTDQMRSKIDSLSTSLNESKSTLNNFKSEVENSGSSEEVQVMLTMVVKDIEVKTKSLEVLQNQLDAVDVAFDDLFFKFSETLSELDNAKSSLSETEENLHKTQQYLNTVWYVIDNYNNLENNQIIEKEGGVMGIGGQRTLKPNLNTSHFTKADKNNLLQILIPVEVKKMELITTHPKESYHVQDKTLIIDNPNDFWSVSKYLVIGLK